jgi:hypothetical protein
MTWTTVLVMNIVWVGRGMTSQLPTQFQIPELSLEYNLTGFLTAAVQAHYIAIIDGSASN